MIYIAAHKQFEVPKLENYVPLQVGAEGKGDLGYLRDDTGDNISIKNPNFCELTGLYWIWKNTSDEYKGLVHYRRYFGRNNFSRRLKDIYPFDRMVSMLLHSDIILPYVEYFKENAKEEILIKCCTPDIFASLEEILKSKYPDYATSFDRYFADNKSVLFNMMFCRRELFDSYCAWLFDILFELEKKVDLNKLNDYQKRLYGFLSERLLNVWIQKNELSYINLSIINPDMKISEKIKLSLRRCYHKVEFREETIK